VEDLNMAKILDFQLKAVKTFPSLEGYGCSANIYYKNKKVGEFLDEGRGGEYRYDFDDRNFEKLFSDARVKYFLKHPIIVSADEKSDTSWVMDNDSFFDELFTLHDREKQYKDVMKHGVKTLVYTKYPLFEKGRVPVPVMCGFRCDEKHPAVENFKSKKQLEHPTVLFDTYTSLDDFIIKE
jgi:hypothetical protein